MTEPSTPPPPPRPQGKRGRAVQMEYAPVGTSRTRNGSGTTRRSRTRWGLLAVAAVLVGFLVYSLVQTGGDESARIGDTVQEGRGVGLNVGAPQMYAPDAAAPAGGGEQIYQVVVAVNNTTDKVMAASDVEITATVDGEPAEAVHPDGPLTQSIEPGVQLNIPFRFKIKQGASGPYQVAVKNPDGRVVYFNGTL